MVSNTLKWIDHVNYIIKKANKRLYFLVLLRCSKVPADDIRKFYCTCMRQVLQYCAPVFHNSLPGYLSNEIERIRKRALSIIFPGHFTPTVLRLITLIPWQKDVRNYTINFSSPLFPIQTTSYFRSCHPDIILVTT